MKWFAPALIATLTLAGAAHAEEKIWSYEPADAATRQRLGTGLTFVFDKGLFGMRVKEVLATEARASLILEPAAERDLGARLDRVIPPGTGAAEVYRITEREQGPGMVRALCPGSTKGWLVFSPLRARQGLTVHALGDEPGGGKARHCATLRFTYRGEWNVPPAARARPTLKPFEPPRPPF